MKFAWPHVRASRPPGVDFQHPSQAHRPLVAALWAVAVGVILITWQHWQRMEYEQEQTDVLEQQFIQLTRRQEQLIQAAIRLSPHQKQLMAAFAQQTATPFSLMNAVARAWSADVALTRVEVNTLAGQLQLDLEARQLGDAFRFVERLKAQPGVYVNLQHSTRKADDPQRPVQVKLTVGAE